MTDDAVEALFAEVPRYADALLAAWDADGAFDGEAWERALVDMGQAGQVGFVLLSWARLISCASSSDEALFRGIRESGQIEPDILDHGVRLVETARTANMNRMIPLMQDISTALDDIRIQQLIWSMAYLANWLLRQVGGAERLRELVTVTFSCARAMDSVITAEPLAFAIGCLAQGHTDAGREAMAALAELVPLPTIVLTLVVIAASTMTSPGTQITLDEQGIPASVARRGESGASGQAQLLSQAVEAIHAIKAGDAAMARGFGNMIRTRSLEQQSELSWSLVVSLGIQFRKHGAQAP